MKVTFKLLLELFVQQQSNLEAKKRQEEFNKLTAVTEITAKLKAVLKENQEEGV